MSLLGFKIEDSVEVHILVGAGARRRLGRVLGELAGAGHAMLVLDSGLPRGLAGELEESLRGAGLRLDVLVLPGGEQVKTLETVTRLWSWMLERGAARDSVLVAAGGGAVTDTAGFAAATYMRGINWAVVPTTLLAMADAAMGGKTGVNYGGKNMVGAFHQPRLIVSDVELALTLPEKDYVSGLAEVVKHGLLAGPGELARLEQLAPRLASRDTTALEEAVEMSAKVKMGIVARDPRETKGERMKLNLGHTYAHALEKATGYRIPHGHAVAIGLNVELRAAEKLLGFPPEERQRIKSLMESLGLPTRPPGEPSCSEIMSHIRVDKKRRGGGIVLPLPRQPGEVELLRLPLEEARRILEEACTEARREPGREPEALAQ